MLVTAPDGTIKSCNQASQELLGYSPVELVGKPLTSFIDEAHRGAFDPSHEAPEAREKRCCAPRPGQTIPVSMASSAIETEDPQFQGSILCGAQHHGAQACRTAHPLPGAAMTR